MVAVRFAVLIRDKAEDRRRDLEAIFLTAFRAADVFQTVGIGHAGLPVASAMAATASRHASPSSPSESSKSASRLAQLISDASSLGATDARDRVGPDSTDL